MRCAITGDHSPSRGVRCQFRCQFSWLTSVADPDQGSTFAALRVYPAEPTFFTMQHHVIPMLYQHEVRGIVVGVIAVHVRHVKTYVQHGPEPTLSSVWMGC
jgi:hypothetical protein